MTNPTQPAEGMPELKPIAHLSIDPKPYPYLPRMLAHDNPVKGSKPVVLREDALVYGRQCAEAASAKCPRHGAYMCVACRKGEVAPKAPPMPTKVRNALHELNSVPWPMSPHKVRQMRILLDWLKAQGITRE